MTNILTSKNYGHKNGQQYKQNYFDHINEGAECKTTLNTKGFKHNNLFN